MSPETDFLDACECHSPDDLRAALAAGVSAVEPVKGKSPLDTLIEGYLRSPRFADCVRVLLDAGATTGDPLLEAVLLDNDSALRRILADDLAATRRRLSIPCAFTSCEGVTPLHLCAEFNAVHCARLLLSAGAAIDAPADTDRDGIGGQTPLFHAVNSIHNYCRPMLELLLAAGAAVDVRLKGLVWGRGQSWETLLVDVTPLSYAQAGLYAQFHRKEQDVYANLDLLYRKRYGSALPARNVPNRYLAPKS